MRGTELNLSEANFGLDDGVHLTALTYWQAKEISRVINENDPEAAGVDIALLSHISPIEWSNVILYGEYKLNRELVK